GPEGPPEVRALGSPLPMAAAVFRGFVDPTQLELHATFAGGKTAEVELASRRADAPDPAEQSAWAVYGQGAYPHVAGGICASFWQPLPRFRDIAAAPLADQACGRLGRPGYWFGVPRTLGAPPARAGRPAPPTVVTGGARSGVA